MNSLPQSIESALEEAGFTGTEILVIKRLLEEDALTVRELAAKTGKSTGVLDQSIKKLLRKGILDKQWINETNRYTLHSLDAVAKWMAEDLQKKHEMMLRKHQNFEAFVSTLKVDKNRPDVRYFDGLAGLAQAYRELLKPGTEILSFVPVFCAAEDDPLRDFRVEYFRERRRRGVFQRVIAHNTPLGRRYQSRDPFEYRQTMLVEEAQFPFTFEKVVAGDLVACINHAEKRACVMRYPEMASQERGIFEGIWKSGGKKIEAVLDESATQPIPATSAISTLVPLSTRTLSALRDFFLSKKSIAAFAAFAVLAASATFSLYAYTKHLEFAHMQETVRSIASTGAFQLNPADLDALRKEEDWQKPQWTTVVHQLEQIRRSNDDIAFVYLFRKNPADPAKLEFVADSHSINPYANTDDDSTNNVDVNHDGKIDGADYLQWPGQVYPDAPAEAYKGFAGPATSEDFYIDTWGTFISGYAPILRNGETVAVLAVDMSPQTLQGRLSAAFSPILFFLALFFLFVLIRLAAFNRSLMQELLQVINLRKVGIAILCCAALSGAMTFGLYRWKLSSVRDRIAEKVISIATTGALQFDARDLEQLHTVDDIHKPEYAKVIKTLNDIRYKNTGIKFAYIMRPTNDSRFLEFIADADSIDPYKKGDLNGDGMINDADHLSPPGEKFDISTRNYWKKAILEPVHFFDEETQWGSFITAGAPIKDSLGKSVAVLGIDKKLTDIATIAQQEFSILLWFIAIFSFLLIIAFFLQNLPLSKEIWRLLQLRKLLLFMAFVAEVTILFFVCLYYYNLHQLIQENGKKLMAIASTAAATLNADELDQIHKYSDVKSLAYENTHNKLYKIRINNPDVLYAYVFRLTDKPDIWEWIADADTTASTPYYTDDNNNGPDTADVNTYPGVRYVVPIKDINYKAPYYTKKFYSDQWGTYLSGLAPIYKNNRLVAVVGMDMDVSTVLEQQRINFRFQLFISLGFFFFCFVGWIFLRSKNA